MEHLTRIQCNRVVWGVRKLILAVLVSVIPLVASAQEHSKADSINALAEDADFIKSSLLIVEPGNKVYSNYGHAAIRLQSPVNQLDYCFTFEMQLGALDQLKFLFSTAKAGYATFSTEQFLEQYRNEHRGITEYALNLNPRQEQELWRWLDNQLQRGMTWDYNFLTKNCSSMCVYAVESSLMGEKIVYHDLHPALTGTYGDLLDYISRNAPWSKLFWKLRMGSKGSETGDLNDKLAPELLPGAWQKATLVDSGGVARPVFIGEPVQLLPYSGKQAATFITPFGAIVLLSIIAILFILCFTLKKCKVMKIFTFKKSLLSAAIMLLTTASAFAGNSYVPIYGQLYAYPTGAGKVYAELEEGSVAEDGSTASQPADMVDVKFVYKGITPTGYFYGHAQAEEGWLFAGFATEKYVDGEPVLPETVEDDSNPAYLKVPSAVYKGLASMFSSEEEAFAAGFPADPDAVHYALFTHVAPRISGTGSRLGSVAIDKTVNYVGEDVTITATVKDKYQDQAQFSHWVEKSTGKEIKENPYTLTVAGVEEYEAVFTSDLLFEVEFPEEGGYIEWYRDCQAYFPETTEQMNFVQPNLKKNDARAYFEVQPTASFVEPKTAAFLYAKGKQIFLDEPSETKPSGINFYGNPLEKWSGEEGVAVEEVTQVIEMKVDGKDKDVEVGDITAYLFDKSSETFKRVEGGFVPANRVFLAIPKQLLDGLEEGFVPDVIYLSEEGGDIDGIGNMNVKPTVKNGKTYTIDGRQVAEPNQNGIYIYDGKKLIFRKK